MDVSQRLELRVKSRDPMSKMYPVSEDRELGLDVHARVRPCKDLDSN